MTPVIRTASRRGRVLRYLAISLALGVMLTIASQTIVAWTSPDADPTSPAYLEFRGWPQPFAMTLVNPANDPGVEIRFREQWLPSYMDDGFVAVRIAMDVMVFGAVAFAVLLARPVRSPA